MCGTSGRQYFHAISAGDPRYNPAEADDKIDRRPEGAGATLCATLRDSAPGAAAICACCPHWGKINSPIALGYRHEDTLPQVEEVTPEGEIDSIAAAVSASAIEADQGVFDPDRFRVDGYGRVFATEDKKGRLTVPFLEARVELRAILKNEIDGQEILAVRFLRPGRDEWEETLIYPTIHFGSRTREHMMSKGMLVHHGDLFRSFIDDQYARLARRSGVEVCYESFGAKRAGFLYAGKLYSRHGVTPAWCGEEVTLRSAWMQPPAGASLEEWAKLVSVFFQPGMETHALTVLAGFAGPLMRYLSTIEGGAIFANVSPESARGKSTSLAAAQSIFGRKALDLTERDTANARFAAMACMGDLTITYNEMPVNEGLFDLVKAFDAGGDKMRMDSSGTRIRHPKGGWNTVFITNANKSLFDYLQTNPDTDAQAWRVMEFRAELIETAKLWDGDRMREQFFAHAGVAGDAYLRRIYCEPEALDNIKQRLRAVFKTLGEQTKWPHQARYWLRLLSAMQVAGELACQLKLIPHQPHSYIRWAIEKQGEKLKQGTITSNMNSSATALVTMLNELHNNTLVVRIGTANGGAVYPTSMPHGPLYIRREENTGLAYVARDTFRQWMMKHHHGWREARLNLFELGVCSGEVGYDLGHGTTLSSGVMPCMVFNMKHPYVAGQEAQRDETSGISGSPPGGASSLHQRVH